MVPRLIAGVVVVLVAARLRWTWLVPIGVLVAQPVIWIGGIPAFFIAAARLAKDPRLHPVDGLRSDTQGPARFPSTVRDE
jgi:hypothetical protein